MFVRYVCMRVHVCVCVWLLEKHIFLPIGYETVYLFISPHTHLTALGVIILFQSCSSKMSFPGGASGKELPANEGDMRHGSGRSPGEGNGYLTPSSILAWRIPWTEKPGGLQFIGLHRVRHNWSDLACMHAQLVCLAVHLKLTWHCISNILQ